MGERCNRTAEVSGSIPLGSTNKISALACFWNARNPLDIPDI
jgi:hypothetical protein